MRDALAALTSQNIFTMIGQAAGIGTPWRALLCALAVAITRNGRTHIGAEVGGVSAASVVPASPSGGGAPVELCPLFGGSCCRNCSVVLRHRWNITLCLDPEDQCCISEQCSQEVITSQRPADDASATRTECETEGGNCQAWWHHCEGAKVARRCGYIWQSCCNATKVDGDIVGDSATPKRDGAAGGRPWLSWHRARAGQRGGSRRYPTLSDATKTHNEEQQDSVPSEQSHAAGFTCGVLPASANDNGNDAAEAEWPWQARVETESGVAYCSGIVVDRLWVLTSASCFSGMTGEHLASHRVVIGRRNLNSTGSGYQTYAISGIIRHPYYGEMHQQLRRNQEHGVNRHDVGDVDSATRPDGVSNGGDAQAAAAPCSRLQHQRTILHDQAMLRVAEAIAFDEYVSPACLPARRARSGRHACSVSGVLRHSRPAHGAHSAVSGEAGAESQRRTQHTAQGRMHDAVSCGKFTGNEGDNTQMCFERDHSEVLSQFLPGAFVTCLSDEGQHVVAAMNSGNFHHCHGKAMSVVTALPPNSFWIRNVIESSADTSGEAEQPALEGSPPSL